MFTNCYNQGVQFTFANGLTISIQWGKGNYCQNQSSDLGSPFTSPREILESIDAEIAIWDQDGYDYCFENDNVKGWVATDEVAYWITEVQSAKSLSDILSCE